MESEVASLLCLECDGKTAFGRSQGPQFFIKDAIGDTGTGARRTTAVSRAWRRSANWLNNLLNRKWDSELGGTIQKLLHYRHPAPPKLTATKEHLVGSATFEAWRSVLIIGRLKHNIWIECFKSCAINNAESQERAAQRAALC